jgi:hypothetical protein
VVGLRNQSLSSLIEAYLVVDGNIRRGIPLIICLRGLAGPFSVVLPVNQQAFKTSFSSAGKSASGEKPSLKNVGFYSFFFR